MLRQSPLAGCVRITLSAVLLFLASTPLTARAQSSDDFVPVTDAILQDPAPEAFFVGFGESSLDFELHAYIDHPANQWVARHELHDGINRAFADGGLEIAFPQRDLHIRSADASLLAQLVKPAKAEEPAKPDLLSRAPKPPPT